MAALDGGGGAPTSPPCLRGAGSLRSTTTLASVLEEADFTYDDALPCHSIARRSLSKSCWDTPPAAAPGRLPAHGRSYEAPGALADSLDGLVRARTSSDNGETRRGHGGGSCESLFFHGLDPSGHSLQPVDPRLLKEMWGMKVAPEQQQRQQWQENEEGDERPHGTGVACAPAADGASVFQALCVQYPEINHDAWPAAGSSFQSVFSTKTGQAPPPSLASSLTRASSELQQRHSPQHSVAAGPPSAARDFGRTSHNENQQQDAAAADPAASPGSTDAVTSLAFASWSHTLVASSLAGYHQPSSKLYKSASAFELYADTGAAEGRVRAGVGRHHEGKVRGGRRYPTEPGMGGWDQVADRQDTWHLMSAPLPVLDVLSNTEAKMRGGKGAMEGRVRGGQALEAQPRGSDKGSGSSRSMSFDGTSPMAIHRAYTGPMPEHHNSSSAAIASLTSASLTQLDRSLSSAHLQPVTLQRFESTTSFGKLYRVRPLGSLSPNGSLSPRTTAGSLTRTGSANGGYLTAASHDGSCTTLFELAEYGSSHPTRGPLTSYNSASSAMLVQHFLDPAMMDMLASMHAANNNGNNNGGSGGAAVQQQQQQQARMRSESDCGRRIRGGASAAAVGTLLEGAEPRAVPAVSNQPMWFLSTEFPDAVTPDSRNPQLGTAVEDDGCERDPITGTRTSST